MAGEPSLMCASDSACARPSGQRRPVCPTEWAAISASCSFTCTPVEHSAPRSYSTSDRRAPSATSLTPAAHHEAKLAMANKGKSAMSTEESNAPAPAPTPAPSPSPVIPQPAPGRVEVPTGQQSNASVVTSGDDDDPEPQEPWVPQPLPSRRKLPERRPSQLQVQPDEEEPPREPVVPQPQPMRKNAEVWAQGRSLPQRPAAPAVPPPAAG